MMNTLGFVARKEFPQYESIARSYFLGHHKAGLDKMRQLLGLVDLVVECRDCRVPLSSRNPLFEGILGGKERVIVYTKRDLGGRSMNEATQTIMKKWHAPQSVLFANFRSRDDVKLVLKHAREHALALDSLVGMRIMVVGMPNVGKSSLLNALRGLGVNKKKAAMTGAQPGVTRNIGTSVKISEDPVVHLIDTPGVFVPYMPNATTMLKLALVGCIKDTIVDPIIVCDYLLFRLNLINPRIYSDLTSPTNDIFEFLEGVARRIGRIRKGGSPDIEGAAIWTLSRYRAGSLGKFVLDDIHEGAYNAAIEEEREQAPSGNQRRKQIIADRIERRMGISKDGNE